MLGLAHVLDIGGCAWMMVHGFSSKTACDKTQTFRRHACYCYSYMQSVWPSLVYMQFTS